MTPEELQRLLRDGFIQSQAILDTLQLPLVVLDPEFNVLSGNRAFFEMFELADENVLGHSLFDIGDERWDVAELRLLLDNVIPKSQAIIGFRLAADVPGRGRRELSLDVRRLERQDHAEARLLLEMEDVTESEAAKETHKLLLEESLHRMRNLMAVVSGLARHTRIKGRTAEEFREAFLARMKALLQAQEISLDPTYECDLHIFVRRALFAACHFRLQLGASQPVLLKGQQARGLGLILQELATNAMKYGALLKADGVVRIWWTVETDTSGSRLLRLRWQEENGPPVETPAAQGFGFRLMSHSAEQDLGGGIEFLYEPDGLRAEISARLGPPETAGQPRRQHGC